VEDFAINKNTINNQISALKLGLISLLSGN